MSKLIVIISLAVTFLMGVGCQDDGKSALQKKMEETAARNKEIKEKIKEEKKAAEKKKWEQEEKELPPIVEAAKDKDLAKVKKLIGSGKNVDIVDHRKRTPLMFAVQNGLIEMVSFLIEKGADVKGKRIDGDTVLMAACRNGNKEIYDLLIEKKADPNVTDNFGRTPLMMAAWKGHLDIVKDLIVTQKVDINAKDKYELSALIFSLKGKNKPIAQYLLAKGAEVWKEKKLKPAKPKLLQIDDKPKISKEEIVEIEKKLAEVKVRQKTELFYAVESGDLELVKLLIKKGSPVLVEDMKRRKEVILIPKGKEEQEHMKLIEEVEKRTSYDQDQKNLLMYAAEGGYPKILKLLIKKGAKLEETDGETVRGPLFYTVTPAKGDAEFEKRLAACARIIIKEGKKTYKHKRRLTKKEIEKEKKKNSKKAWYNQNQTDLMWKIEDRPKVDIEAYDYEGWTVLTLAAMNGHYEVVKTLIDAGVMINRKERKFGRTALIYSRISKYPRIEKLLKENGALEGINFDAEELEKEKKKAEQAKNNK